MAVLGASRAYKDWRTANGLANADETIPDESIEGDEVATEESPVENPISTDAAPSASKVSEYSDEQLQEMERADALELMDSVSTRVGSSHAATSRTLTVVSFHVSLADNSVARSIPNR